MKIRFLLSIALCWITFLNAFDSSSTNDSTNSALTECNALKNLKKISILPQYSFSSSKIRDKINEEVSKELGKFGTVVKLKVPDTTGFGNSEAFLSIMVEDISTWNDKKLPITQTSLYLDTAILVKKTGISCTTHTWSASTFSEGTDEKNALSSITTLLKQFIENYQSVNSQNQEKPTFYLYIP